MKIVDKASEISPLAEAIHELSSQQVSGYELHRNDYLKEEQESQEEKEVEAAEDDIERLAKATNFSLFSVFIPFQRADLNDETREVIGIATKEELDAHGTIITFEGSKKAFARWSGNIREMHQPIAVGKAIEWAPLEDQKAILLKCQISKSADGDNTWTKIKENILKGFSIGGSGKPSMITRNGQSIPTYEDYELTEVSIVDAPSCPSAQLVIARADGFVDSNIINDQPLDTETQEEKNDDKGAKIERAGARLSTDSQWQIHAAIDANLATARSLMAMCDCDQCQYEASILDPDGDGDVDLDPDLDTDANSDTDQSDSNTTNFDEEMVERAIEKALVTLEVRLSEKFAKTVEANFTRLTPQNKVIDAIQQQMNGQAKAIATISDVRSELSKVQADVARMASLPRLGNAPILNGSVVVDRNGAQHSPELSEEDMINMQYRSGELNPHQYREALNRLKQA